jgi:regulator of protease activity HflC (stomatin/prohibitin superfamily)
MIQRIASTAALAALVALAACTNPKVPAGHEGYIYQQPLVFGQLTFERALRGPSSTGVSWRLFVVNIDMQALAYKEDFQLLTSDNLTVAFEVTTNIKLRDGSVKEIVESWGGQDWYAWNVKEPLRTIVREQVSRFSATAIQLETPKVKTLIEEKLREKYEGTPIGIENVAIGEIQFPKDVADAIQRKIAKIQELERQEFVLAKTKKEAAIRVLEALRIAKQQAIISSTLDPLYVQQRAVEVYKKLAQSPNKTIVALPTTAEGTGLPQVLTEGRRKILSPADEALLRRMEEQYMDIAKAPPLPVEGGGEPAADPAAAPVQPEPLATPPASPPTP